ncbi:MAG: hypothetical protein J3R72DRAFT_498688 [Linnemannia gamsii]|nr:MAG: hypothetical protein J3R72DRAFT_498688 [Linnemannia gamsii]
MPAGVNVRGGMQPVMDSKTGNVYILYGDITGTKVARYNLKKNTVDIMPNPPLMGREHLFWTQGPSVDASEARWGMVCAVALDQVVVWGGHNNLGLMPDTPLIFDMKANEWVDNFRSRFLFASGTIGSRLIRRNHYNRGTRHHFCESSTSATYTRMPAPTYNPPFRSASKNDAASNVSMPQSPTSVNSRTIVSSGHRYPFPSAKTIAIPSSAYSPSSRCDSTTTTQMAPAPTSAESSRVKFKSQEQIYELDQGSDDFDQSITDVDVSSTSSGRSLSSYSRPTLVDSLSPPGSDCGGTDGGDGATVTLNMMLSGNPQYIPHEAQYEGFTLIGVLPSNTRVNNPQDGSATERCLDSQRHQSDRITGPRNMQGGREGSTRAGGSGGSGVGGQLVSETHGGG